MMETKGECPYCGKKLENYMEEEWKYGSPIKVCKKCGEKYLDKRYHEIEIEGIAPDALSVRRGVIGIIAGLIFIAISSAINFATITLDKGYSLEILAVGVMGLILLVFMIIDIIRIKTGLKARRFAALRVESAQRLKNKSYAYTLLSLGYKVPQKYL